MRRLDKYMEQVLPTTEQLEQAHPVKRWHCITMAARKWGETEYAIEAGKRKAHIPRPSPINNLSANVTPTSKRSTFDMKLVTNVRRGSRLKGTFARRLKMKSTMKRLRVDTRVWHVF